MHGNEADVSDLYIISDFLEMPIIIIVNRAAALENSQCLGN